MGKKQQGESVSKRQMRKEELRKKERKQRMITLGALGVGALILLAAIIIPSIQSANNPGGKIVEITPVAYENISGTRIGDPNAKVKIVIFEDFQCSACAKYEAEFEPDVIAQIVNKGLAYYEFHHYPFLDDSNIVKESDLAALASECAVEQDRFWDYKKILYTNQTGVAGQFSMDRLKAFAKSLKLDMESFESCLETAKYQANIDADIALGTELGVSGTPTVFVNGVDVSPGMVPNFNQIFQLVQQKAQEN